jgi:hypothetical protein
MALVVVWLLVVARNTTLRLDWYTRVTDQTIVVMVDEGRRAWTRVTHLTETPSRVSIQVESFEWLPGLGNASAQLLALTIHLEEPLGDRLVVDGQGNPVPRFDCFDPPCS